MLHYVRTSHFVSKQNKLMTTISAQALYNPNFNLQTASQFPKHFHSLGYTSVMLRQCAVHSGPLKARPFTTESIMVR